MPRTSLKRPDRRKSRIAQVVASTDQCADKIMVEAIEKRTAFAERRKRFVAEALAAKRAMQRTGKGYLASVVRGYPRAKASERKVRRPKAGASR